MTVQLYFTCFVVAFLGMILQIILKLRALKIKADMAGEKLNALSYIKEDWLSVSASIVTILLTLFFVSEILDWKPAVINYVKIGFAFVGYTGSDIMSRFFSVVNTRINNALQGFDKTK